MVRAIAALIALGVAIAIVSRLFVTMDTDQVSLPEALWINYRFFTLWTNTVLGLVCGWIALGGRPPQWMTSGLVLAIAIVGGVYHAILAHLNSYDGLALFVDVMVHTVVPIAYCAFWLVLLPKPALSLSSMVYWLAYPLIYCIYAIVRGAIDGVYPYPFLDIADLGIGAVAVNIAGLVLVFVVGGLAILGIARVMPRAT